MIRKHISSKTSVAAALIGAMTICVAGITHPKNDHQFTNLKVLPKNISVKQLQRIMVDEFQDGLGVNCAYCHTPESEGSTHFNFASDDKPEKQIARKMMSMTLGINKKHFEVKRPYIGEKNMVVTCITCHQGSPRPAQ
jgi:hypothetical protein